jgi:EAL domain-containing protein (putative c-di-GMP-specific phosphodiesterase class I)
MTLDVIAEGIENNEQLLFLRNQGCSEGQGFFFGKPVPPGEIENLLRRDDRN